MCEHSLDYWSVTVASENTLYWTQSPRESQRGKHTERRKKNTERGGKQNKKENKRDQLYGEQMKDGTHGQGGERGEDSDSTTVASICICVCE